MEDFQHEIALEERIDALIDRATKRLIQIKAMKQMLGNLPKKGSLKLSIKNKTGRSDTIFRRRVHQPMPRMTDCENLRYGATAFW